VRVPRRRLGSGKMPIRVMVVDDSVVIAADLAWIDAEPDMKVAGRDAHRTRTAVNQLERVNPDVSRCSTSKAGPRCISALPTNGSPEARTIHHHGFDLTRRNACDQLQGAVARAHSDYIPKQESPREATAPNFHHDLIRRFAISVPRSAAQHRSARRSTTRAEPVAKPATLRGATRS